MIARSTYHPAPRVPALPRTEFDRWHEDFQSADMVLEIGTHVHETTSNDVVTGLRSDELCRSVSFGARQFMHIRGTRKGMVERS
jgi:hypothetical protein